MKIPIEAHEFVGEFPEETHEIRLSLAEFGEPRTLWPVYVAYDEMERVLMGIQVSYRATSSCFEYLNAAQVPATFHQPVNLFWKR